MDLKAKAQEYLKDVPVIYATDDGHFFYIKGYATVHAKNNRIGWHEFKNEEPEVIEPEKPKQNGATKKNSSK